LENLEKGDFFQSKSDAISEKDKLKTAITDLTAQLHNLQSEITEIK